MIGLHAGIAIVLGLWYFSALMIVLNVSAQLIPASSGSAVRMKLH